MAIDCLDSIATRTPGLSGLRAVVVDNASSDGSAEKLVDAVERNRWHMWASVLPLDRNGGFAAGNNAGVRQALQSDGSTDYFLLLNPDTLVREGAIRALVDFMDANPDVGIAGSRQESASGAAESTAHNAVTPLGELESSARLGVLSRMLRRYAVSPPVRESAHECDWVSGGSLIVRYKVLEDIGGLDEGFFLYFEEVDFCLRARRAGWKVWYVPQSRVVHLEGSSSGIRDTQRRRPPYWYDSRRRYFVKHFGVPGLMLADTLWAIGRLSMMLRHILRLKPKGDTDDPKRYALDLLGGDLRAILTRGVFKISREDDAS